MRFFLLLSLCLASFFGFSQDYKSNELLIQFNPKFSASEAFNSHVLNNRVVTYRLISKHMNIFQVEFDSDENIESLQKEIKNWPEVINVQKNHLLSNRETIPNDTDFASNQWYLKNTGQTGGTVDADIDATDAWDISTGGVTTHNDTIVVCILEGSGVDITHEDLVDNIWINHQEIPDNGIDDDGNGYIDDYNGWNIDTDSDNIDAGSHGTRVAGMIGAVGDNNIGISGVNHQVKMMVVQGQNASDEASVIEAYSYPLEMRKLYNQSHGQSGAFVVATNASWGIDYGNAADSPLWCAMYDTLGQYGVINIGATANNSVNVDVVGDLPTTCPSDYLIAVTMTTSTDVRASAGYGTTNIDLGAPGSGVYLTYPSDGYGTTSGTSFATPCVAGSVALLYSTPCPDFINYTKAYPDSAALKVRELILENVDPISSLSTEVASGGRLNINNAMLDLYSNCNTNSCIAPYNLSYSNLIDTSATISWEGFSTDYLFYLTEGNSPEVELDATGINSLDFDTLIPCTNYSVQVKAICGAQESEYSYPMNFRTDGCCENPSLTSSDQQNNSITIEWSDVLYATEYNLRYKKEDETVWTEMNDLSSPYVFSTLDSCSVYDFQINTICTDSTRGYSDTFQFSTKGCGACYDFDYCEVTAGNSQYEWIDSIKVNNHYIGTGNNGGWLTYDDVDIAFLPGSSSTLSIIPGYSSSNYTEHISIWIDLNQDGVFDDATEKLVNDITTSTSITTLLTIPASTMDGITKMRIAMIYGDSPESCPTSSFYGEYEDYCVYFGDDASADAFEFNSAVVNVFPNPSNDVIHVTSSTNINQVNVLSLDGKVVQTVSQSFDQIYIDQLPAGIYLVEVIGENTHQYIKLIKE